MIRYQLLFLGTVASLLAACSSHAPRAPMGFDKRPANSLATVAGLLHPIELARPVSTPAPSGASLAGQTHPPERLQTQPGASDVSTVVILSDFSAPQGLASLSPSERQRILRVARSARRIELYCRGDRRRPSKAGHAAILRRGVRVMRFLLAQGVDAARIRLFVRSTGAFVADNRTASGRAMNRRVEIRFA